jgi:pectin methylesterase-like acyl-CoA thioesterase
MRLSRKKLTIGIILLFILTAIIPSAAQKIENAPVPTPGGKWLYVGGNGPGNYTKIQDAIDNASSGDTVFVYHGTYYEQLRIDIPIRLIGESKNDTIINAKKSNNFLILIEWDQMK